MKNLVEFYKGVPLYHDKSHPVTAGFELVENPLYSLDLAHSNFPLFSWFSTSNDVICGVNVEVEQSVFLSGSRNSKPWIGRLC